MGELFQILTKIHEQNLTKKIYEIMFENVSMSILEKFAIIQALQLSER